ncbi:MAG: LysM peptidoglycan-binding domain-containing protein, partial [Puniceicoccales bacterium]|nr:LysM peptidoglycan-binding domain-containing protein [Puniceicoccales bacterium]
MCDLWALVFDRVLAFSSGKSRDERIDNVAYGVPESVAKSGVDVRKKPTKPSWTEDVYGHKELEFKPARPAPISSSGGEVYVVKKGDTIYGIARCFGFSPRKIMELNDMDRSSKLYVGQTMKLPGKIS